MLKARFVATAGLSGCLAAGVCLPAVAASGDRPPSGRSYWINDEYNEGVAMSRRGQTLKVAGSNGYDIFCFEGRYSNGSYRGWMSSDQDFKRTVTYQRSGRDLIEIDKRLGASAVVLERASHSEVSRYVRSRNKYAGSIRGAFKKCDFGAWADGRQPS